MLPPQKEVVRCHQKGRAGGRTCAIAKSALAPRADMPDPPTQVRRVPEAEVDCVTRSLKRHGRCRQTKRYRCRRATSPANKFRFKIGQPNVVGPSVPLIAVEWLQ